MPVLIGVVGKDLLGTCILFADKAAHFRVDLLSGFFRIRLSEIVFLIIVEAKVGKFAAHAEVSHHAVGTLRHALQVVERARGDVSGEYFFGCAAGERGADLVEHLLFRGDVALFGQIPCRAEGLSARHDGHLHQRVGVLQEP